MLLDSGRLASLPIGVSGPDPEVSSRSSGDSNRVVDISWLAHTLGPRISQDSLVENPNNAFTGDTTSRLGHLLLNMLDEVVRDDALRALEATGHKSAEEALETRHQEAIQRLERQHKAAQQDRKE